MPVPNHTSSTPTHGEAQLIPVAERWFGSWRVAVGRRPLAPHEVSSVYDRSAKLWDLFLYLLGTRRAYFELFAHMRLAGMLGGSDGVLQVLDCGVGTAAMALALAEFVPSPMELTGIDLSPDMLVRARKALASRGLTAKLQCADIQSMRLPERSLDLVIAGHVLEHLGDPAQALRVIYDSLRPGGRLLIVTTRHSLFSLPIQIGFRTHRWRSSSLARAVRFAGFVDCEPVGGVGGPMFQQLSLVMLARKPLDAE